MPDLPGTRPPPGPAWTPADVLEFAESTAAQPTEPEVVAANPPVPAAKKHVLKPLMPKRKPIHVVTPPAPVAEPQVLDPINVIPGDNSTSVTRRRPTLRTSSTCRSAERMETISIQYSQKYPIKLTFDLKETHSLVRRVDVTSGLSNDNPLVLKHNSSVVHCADENCVTSKSMEPTSVDHVLEMKKHVFGSAGRNTTAQPGRTVQKSTYYKK